jgi:DNA (cytosine-5)-methyltransferase 1
MSTKKIIKVSPKLAISLFSGAGGDTLGLTRAGYKVVAFSEFNKQAIQTHLKNFPDSVHLKTKNSTDIKDIPDDVFEQYKGKVDVVFAGFPCQGFSNAGKKKENDPRNELVYEFVRAVRCIQPKWFIGENVRGLLSRKGIDPKTNQKLPIIQIIQSIFKDINYNMTWNIVSATNYGVPQERKRLILIGSKEENHPHFPWLYTSDSKPSIRNLLEDTLDGAMEFPIANIPANLAEADIWLKTEKKECTGTVHPNLIRLVNGIRNKSTKEILAETDNKPEELKEKAMKIEGGLISFYKRVSSQHGQICDPDSSSKTIICTYGTCPRLFIGLRNAQTGKYYIRTLTTRELAQIQGFPVDYQFCGNEKSIITQIGNAVPPDIVKYIAENLDKVVFVETPQISLEESDTDSDSDGD